MSKVDLNDEYPEMLISEDSLPGDHTDISGYDPMDYENSRTNESSAEEVAQEYWTEADKDNLKPEAEEEEEVQPTTQKIPSPNALFARNRILERDHRILSERFNALLAAISQNQEGVEGEEEEEVVPFEEDPLTNIHTHIQKLDKKVSQQSAEVQRQAEQAKIRETLQKADLLTEDAISKVGIDTWNAAMQHLANVRVDDYLERNPQYTKDEAERIVGQAIIHEKIRIVESGRNPAEVYLRDAVRFGFRPQGRAPQAAPTPKAPKAPVADARTQIRKQNEREDKGGRTLGGVRGSAPRNRLSAQAILGMDDRQFRDQIDDVIKERGGSGLRLRDFVLPNS